MNRLLEILAVPANSIRTAFIILVDGTKELGTRIKFAFAGGPLGELSQYTEGFREYLRERKLAKVRRKRMD